MARTLSIIALLGLGGLAFASLRPAGDTPGTRANAARAYVPAPGDALQIVQQNWHTGGFGAIAIVNLTLSNGNDYAVKDVHLICRYYAKSGTLLSLLTPVIYDVIRPKARKSFRDLSAGFVHPQAYNGKCDVASALRD